MVDSNAAITSDNAASVVKSSYDDVNNALESLIGNIHTSGGSSASKGLINKQVFSTPGTFTYTPTSGTTRVIAKLIGGGGGGGVGFSTYPNMSTFGLGGRASWYIETPMFNVPTGTVPVTVGAGGSHGTVSYNASYNTFGTQGFPGTNGGLSSFGSYVSTPCGNGGATNYPNGSTYITVDSNTTRVLFLNQGVNDLSLPPTMMANIAYGQNSIPFVFSGDIPGNITIFGGIILGSAGGASYFGPGGKGGIYAKVYTPYFYDGNSFIPNGTNRGQYVGNNNINATLGTENSSSPKFGMANAVSAIYPGAGGGCAPTKDSDTLSNYAGYGADGLVIIEEYA